MQSLDRSVIVALIWGASLLEIHTVCADTISGQVLYELALPVGITDPMFSDAVAGQVAARGYTTVSSYPYVDQGLVWNGSSTAVNLTPGGHVVGLWSWRGTGGGLRRRRCHRV
jgi:hypothetical protein